MGSGQPPLTRRDLTGISTTDLATANALLATLGGYIDGYSQTFNVTSRNSGYVTKAPFLRHFLDNDYSFYVQDKWKVMPRLTLTLGLRYQLPGVVDERDSLELAPVVTGNAPQTLLSNATLNLRGGIGRAIPGITARRRISLRTSALRGTSSATAGRRCAAATR